MRWTLAVVTALLVWTPLILFVVINSVGPQIGFGGDTGGAALLLLGFCVAGLGLPWNLAIGSVWWLLAPPRDWGFLVILLVSSALGNVINGLLVAWLIGRAPRRPGNPSASGT